jgi:hypothetical protein
MKFYNDKNSSLWKKIANSKLTAINQGNTKFIYFYKNGTFHNSKNAANFLYDDALRFYLNGKFYGYKDDFDKKSWRKFVKLKAFL